MADWTRKLPEPVTTGRRRKLRTLADIRDYLLRLPPEIQEQPRCQHVAEVALDSAEGRAEPASVAVAFMLAGLHR
jgi:hypothetical protein